MVYIKINYSVTDVYISGNGDAPVYIKVGSGDGGGSGTVTSVDMTVPTGLTVSGNPITSSGTLAVGLASGYVIPTQATIDGKVPYSGATGNVDLGEYELKAGQIEFDQSPTGTAGVAVTRWNDTVGTIETTLKGGTVVLKHGRDMFERVVNKTGIQLTKAAYQAVKVSDAQGQRLAIGLAQANNDLNSADTIGLVVETIDNNQEGFIYTVGEIDGLNTTGSLQGETWADGDVLYLSPTVAGSITNVKPVAPQHLVVIGYVVYAHANNGKIYVKVMNGWELGELHDVDTAGATNGQVLAYNGSIWVPTTNGSGTVTSITASAPLTGGTITSSGSIGITQASGSADGYLSSTDWTTFNNKQNALTNPITGSAASGQVAYFTGATTQAGSADLTIDTTLGRLNLTKSINGTAAYYVTNTSTGASAIASYSALNGTNTVSYGIYGTNTTSYGALTANNGYFYSTRGIVFMADNATNGILQFATGGNTERMRLFANGNLLLQTGGTFTDSGQRLQVQGDAFIKGSGNTSGTTALTVQNSDGTNLLRVRNDLNTSINYLRLGNSFSTSPYVFPFTTNAGVPDVTGTNLSFYSYTGSNSATNGVFTITGDALTQTSGNHSVIYTNLPFTPTSGTATFSSFRIIPVINQTGGANGITRGLYVQPTLTAAADWRSIEWSNNTGWGLYGAGTANNYLAGDTYIGTTTTSATKFTVSGSETASSAIARGTLINTTLTAAANNDVLVGLDVNPTFTNGAFTGVTNAAIRVTRSTNSSLIGFGIIDATNTIFDIVYPISGGTRFGAVGSDGAMFQGYGGTNPLFPGQMYFDYGSTARIIGTRKAIWRSCTTGAAVEVMTLFSTGNLLIQNGGTHTDAGFRLDVNGTARVQDNFTVSANRNNETYLQVSNTTSGTLSETYLYLNSDSGAGYFSLGKFSSSKNANKIIQARDGYLLNQTAGDIAILNNVATGKIKFAAGGSSTVQMEIASNGTLTSTASATASGAIARGALFNPTLTAAANNDVLVGLDVNPTFTNGAFTGVRNIALRVNGNIAPTGDGAGEIGIPSFAFGIARIVRVELDNLRQRTTSGMFFSLTNGTNNGWFAPTTGNLVLQNGGTFTDAGYRLDVNGTARVQGDTTITGNAIIGVAPRASRVLNIRSDTTQINIEANSVDYAVRMQMQTSGVFRILTGTSSSVLEAFTIFQNQNVAIGTNTDVASAVLNVASTTKGFLPPRMTETQKNAITTPAAGLMVYDTTNNKLYVYDGTTWQAAW